MGVEDFGFAFWVSLEAELSQVTNEHCANKQSTHGAVHWKLGFIHCHAHKSAFSYFTHGSNNGGFVTFISNYPFKYSLDSQVAFHGIQEVYTIWGFIARPLL